MKYSSFCSKTFRLLRIATQASKEEAEQRAPTSGAPLPDSRIAWRARRSLARKRFLRLARYTPSHLGWTQQQRIEMNHRITKTFYIILSSSKQPSFPGLPWKSWTWWQTPWRLILTTLCLMVCDLSSSWVGRSIACIPGILCFEVQMQLLERIDSEMEKSRTLLLQHSRGADSHRFFRLVMKHQERFQRVAQVKIPGWDAPWCPERKVIFSTL